MAQYLISFDEGAMTFPEEELADVDAAAHAVVRAAMEAGVWVFCSGLKASEDMSVVASDGTVTEGPQREKRRHLSGMMIVDVASREEALEWAAKVAGACRCSQEVRELLADPTAYRAPATMADPRGS